MKSDKDMEKLIKSSRQHITSSAEADKRIINDILAVLAERIKPGMVTEELDRITVRELSRYGATSSFKGYRGFPAHLCVSVNEELVHGIPGKRVARQGMLKVARGQLRQKLRGRHFVYDEDLVAA